MGTLVGFPLPLPSPALKTATGNSNRQVVSHPEARRLLSYMTPINCRLQRFTVISVMDFDAAAMIIRVLWYALPKLRSVDGELQSQESILDLSNKQADNRRTSALSNCNRLRKIGCRPHATTLATYNSVLLKPNAQLSHQLDPPHQYSSHYRKIAPLITLASVLSLLCGQLTRVFLLHSHSTYTFFIFH
jgi:hypothetical protein